MLTSILKGPFGMVMCIVHLKLFISVLGNLAGFKEVKYLMTCVNPASVQGGGHPDSQGPFQSFDFYELYRQVFILQNAAHQHHTLFPFKPNPRFCEHRPGWIYVMWHHKTNSASLMEAEESCSPGTHPWSTEEGFGDRSMLLAEPKRAKVFPFPFSPAF